MESDRPAKRKRRQHGGRETEGSDHESTRGDEAIRFQDTESVMRAASPYRVCAARMPLAALTTVWTIGRNRDLQKEQVERLCTAFINGGVKRRERPYNLNVLCKRSMVTRMMDHLRVPDGEQEDLDFTAWMNINRAHLVEVMAGQHRMAALERYIELSGESSDELWWTCEFYDEDTLPLELNIALRTNRNDVTMVDNHGQIWAQMTAAASRNPKLFRGSGQQIQDEIQQVLQLHSESRFPVRRMISIWKNSTWRRMTTSWCKTSLGRETLAITSWEWMMSSRLDDFWSTIFSNIEHTISELPDGIADAVSPSDWRTFSQHLPIEYAEEDVKALFYPKARTPGAAATSQRAALQTPRRKGFLVGLDKASYQRFCDWLRLRSERLCFPKLQPLLNMSLKERQTVFGVLQHVVSWVNEHPEPFSIRSNNKPPIRDDLAPAFLAYSRQLDKPLNVPLDSEYIDRKEKMQGLKLPDGVRSSKTEQIGATLLQHDVIMYVLSHRAGLLKPEAKAYMDEFLVNVGADAYSRRFSNRDWAGLLELVRGYLDMSFHPSWKAAEAETEDDSQPAGLSRSQAATLAESIYSAVVATPSLQREADAVGRVCRSPDFRSILGDLLNKLAIGNADGDATASDSLPQEEALVNTSSSSSRPGSSNLETTPPGPGPRPRSRGSSVLRDWQPSAAQPRRDASPTGICVEPPYSPLPHELEPPGRGATLAPFGGSARELSPGWSSPQSSQGLPPLSSLMQPPTSRREPARTRPLHREGRHSNAPARRALPQKPRAASWRRGVKAV